MSSRWLVDLVTPATGRHRIAFLFPHAGAGVSAVLGTGRSLAPDPHPVAVRLPGREVLLDEEPPTDLRATAGSLANAIGDRAGDADVVLYGHSSGAVLAFETARLLRRPPVLLAVSAQQAPGTPVRTADMIWDRSDAEFFAQVVRDGYLPQALLDDPEALDVLAPALRADYRATHEHLSGHGAVAAREPVRCPILTIRAAADTTVAVADLDAWAGLTTGGHRRAVVDSQHNVLRDRPAEIAAVLRAALR